MQKADGNHALYTFGNYSASAGAPTAKLIYEIPRRPTPSSPKP